MSKINVSAFLGVAPKLADTHLNPTQAQIARDARLISGALRAVRGFGSAPFALSKPTGTIQSIWPYKNEADWLCWTQDVNVVRTPVAGDTLEKIYFTGTDKPRVTTKDLYDDGTPGTSIPPASYILGIPAPVGPPVATDNGAGNINATVTWRYTFVRKWSDGTEDEGPPSPASNVLALVNRQASITVPNGAITTGDFGLTHKRLYRSQGGAYFFVTEVAIGTSPALDNIATANLGVELTTTFYLPPPDGMIGIVELPNGVMAGFKDNIIYLSDPYKPWAYPALNQYAVAWTIVAIGAVGSTLIVATSGYPYIGRGPDPAAYVFQPDRGAYYPCVSKRSLAAGPNAVYWATPEGLASGNANGVTLVSRGFITRLEWQSFKPTTMHAIVYEDRYYAWFNEPTGTDVYGNKAGGAVIYAPGEPAFFSTLGIYSEAAVIKPSTGELWVARKNTNTFNTVFAWDADPSNPDTAEWKSKLFITPGLENFAFTQIHAAYEEGLTQQQIADLQAQIAAVKAFNAAVVSTDGELNDHLLNEVTLNGDTILQTAPNSNFVGGGVIFRYWSDGVLKLERTVTSKEPFPMPSGFRGEKHEFSVSSEIEVQQVTLATSCEELAAV